MTLKIAQRRSFGFIRSTAKFAAISALAVFSAIFFRVFFAPRLGILK